MSEAFETLAVLAGTFAMLSLLAVGGGTAVLPEMKHIVVGQHAWLTAAQFNDYYAIGQFVPGPNMLMVFLIGNHVAGWPGAAVVVVAFFLPFSLLMFFSSRIWDRLSGIPWRESVRCGLAPISIGLMLSGVYAVGHAAITGVAPALIAIGICAAVLFTKISPALLMLVGGLCGFVFMH